MKKPVLHLPESVNRFIEQRLIRGGISAVLLYGSYARGTQHANSDIDIIFVVDEGFKRECVVQDGLLFEVIEQTKSNMYSFMKENKDEDRHWNLWKDVKALYDRDGEGKEIIEHAQLLVNDRQPWAPDEIKMRRLIMGSKIKNIRHVSQGDRRTAALLLVELVWVLIENWFRIRGRFIPSPKELFSILSEEDPVLSGLLNEFYVDQNNLNTRFDVADLVFKAVYDQGLTVK